MFCEKCGKKLKDDSQFCDDCGQKTAPISPASQTVHETFRKNKRGFPIKNHHLILGGLILVLVIVVSSAGYLFGVYLPNQQQVELSAIQDAKNSQQAAQTELASTKQDMQNLKTQTAQEIANARNQASQSTSDLSTVIKKWHPIVAYIYCQFTYTDGTVYLAQSGSGTLILYPNGNRSILTNRHVVTDSSGYAPSTCTIALPFDSQTYTASRSDITIATDGSDSGYVKIEYPDSYLQSMTTSGRNYCPDIPSVGDEVVILGYPGIGSQTDITATDGIISGYDGNYYITSAKVEHGNSGGAAIDVKNNCYLGIPTYVETGTVESLARILKWQAF